MLTANEPAETIMLSNSGHDENGRYSGGKAGDQGGEWTRRTWYDRPWSCVLRHPDPSVRGLIAQLAGEAADNPHVGYDQDERWTFWQQLQSAGYFPAAIRNNCEADCSAGVAAVVKATGYILGLKALQNVSSDLYTGNERRTLSGAGFEVLTDSKYLKSDSYLLPGDILLCEGHHTAVNLSYGAKTSMPKNITAKQLIAACRAFYITERAGHYNYGDSHAIPPCADHVTSCERGAVSRPLWDLGWHDQPAGGVTVLNMMPWLERHHCPKITDPNRLKAGDIVVMRPIGQKTPTAAWHVFLIVEFHGVNNIVKFDFGSQERLRAVQPFTMVPLNQWPGSKEFYCAYRMPGEKKNGDDLQDDDDFWTYDKVFYLRAAPDVVKALGTGDQALKRHYDTFGKSEGREANCLLNPSYYKSKYKDLRKAFDGEWRSYIHHFATYGIKEGRRGSIVFDPVYYKDRYPDLRQAFGNNWPKYYRHFIQFGMSEGRQGSAEFDPKAYRARYKDLDKAYHDLWRMYYIHYLVHGIKEGRKGT